jgi:hypothetical protein
MLVAIWLLFAGAQAANRESGTYSSISPASFIWPGPSIFPGAAKFSFRINKPGRQALVLQGTFDNLFWTILKMGSSDW